MKPPTPDVTSAQNHSAAAEDEYRAKLAERRRLAREKAELEAEQQEQQRRQRQLVEHCVMLLLYMRLNHVAQTQWTVDR